MGKVRVSRLRCLMVTGSRKLDIAGDLPGKIPRQCLHESPTGLPLSRDKTILIYANRRSRLLPCMPTTQIGAFHRVYVVETQ